MGRKVQQADSPGRSEIWLLTDRPIPSLRVIDEVQDQEYQHDSWGLKARNP